MCFGVIVLLAAPVVDWIGKAPDIGRTIQEKLRVFDRPLSVLQDLRDTLLETGWNPNPRITDHVFDLALLPKSADLDHSAGG